MTGTGAQHPTTDDLLQQIDQLRKENLRLRNLLGFASPSERSSLPDEALPTTPVTQPALALVDQSARPETKVAFFRSVFGGRADVYALRWENERTGKSGWSPAVRGGPGNARKADREYLPLSDEVVAAHLAGSINAGLYPLLPNDTCRVLACDFDGNGWALDALAYLEAARAAGISAALERSRSGDGAHVWIFFSGPVPAVSARRLGVHLLREAMNERGELDLASYDRLFPTQDFMPKGSFGNLIALPLQGECRKRYTTVFLEPETLDPVADQWAHLSSLPRLGPETLASLVGSFAPIAAGPDDATFRRPRAGAPQAPETIHAAAGAMLEIEKSGLPPALLAAFKHLASLHNPEFYEKERLRFSTWNTPRFVRCYHETIDRLLLPRGVRQKASAIATDSGSRIAVQDDRPDPGEVDFHLISQLTAVQDVAFRAMSRDDDGVLVAPPGAGKTVIACTLIAHHRRPTLVIVDRKPLVEQWRERLGTHLGLDPKAIGQVGGGRNKTKGIVDIAMAQSLARREDLAELSSHYGFVVVDECHHVPAVTFERCVRQMVTRRWLGLTATPYRRDGLQGLIAMHCGPIRHTMSDRPENTGHELTLVVHRTELLPPDEDAHIQDVFRSLVEDESRTRMIGADIASAVARGRKCLVLTQWTEHVASLAAELRRLKIDPLVLQGGMGTKDRAAVLAELVAPRSDNGLVLVATGGFLGEGFDCPPLDTLFLAFPIAFKGRVVQYVGRVLRPTYEKSTVEVHDYVDSEVPVLARMHRKRLPGFATLGFDTKQIHLH